MSPKRPLVPTRGQAGGAGQSARPRMETRHRGARCAGGALIPGTWTRTSMGCEGGRKLVAAGQDAVETRPSARIWTPTTGSSADRGTQPPRTAKEPLIGRSSRDIHRNRSAGTTEAAARAPRAPQIRAVLALAITLGRRMTMAARAESLGGSTWNTLEFHRRKTPGMVEFPCSTWNMVGPIARMTPGDGRHASASQNSRRLRMAGNDGESDTHQRIVDRSRYLGAAGSDATIATAPRAPQIHAVLAPDDHAWRVHDHGGSRRPSTESLVFHVEHSERTPPEDRAGNAEPLCSTWNIVDPEHSNGTWPW